jgi:hypothetical protein
MSDTDEIKVAEVFWQEEANAPVHFGTHFEVLEIRLCYFSSFITGYVLRVRN